MVPLLVSGLMFLSPVFYASTAAPQMLQHVLLWNPLTAPIELARAAWFGDRFDLAALWPQALALPLLGWAAAWLFARLRPGFADLV